jgi:CRISPR-associated protein Cas2
MGIPRHQHLVTYDIRDPKRWRKVYNLLRGHGERVQYSVFRLRLSETQRAKLQWRLGQLMSSEDALLIIPLCPGCAERIHAHNPADAWPEDDPTFTLIG